MATTSFENDKDPSLPRDLMSASLDLINVLNSKQSVLDKTVRDKDIKKDSTYGKQPSLEYRFMHSPKGSLRYIRHPDDALTGKIEILLPDPAEFDITDTEFESEVDPFDEIDIDKPNTCKAHQQQADINQARIKYYEESVLETSMEISDAEVLGRINHSTDIGVWEALGSQPPSIDLTAEDGGFEFDSDDSDDDDAQSLHSNNPDNPKSAKSWYQNIFAKKSEFPCSSDLAVLMLFWKEDSKVGVVQENAQIEPPPKTAQNSINTTRSHPYPRPTNAQRIPQKLHPKFSNQQEIHGLTTKLQALSTHPSFQNVSGLNY